MKMSDDGYRLSRSYRGVTYIAENDAALLVYLGLVVVVYLELGEQDLVLVCGHGSLGCG